MAQRIPIIGRDNDTNEVKINKTLMACEQMWNDITNILKWKADHELEHLENSNKFQKLIVKQNTVLEKLLGALDE